MKKSLLSPAVCTAITCATVVVSSIASANASQYGASITVEEKRISKAQQQMPQVASRHNKRIIAFTEQLSRARNYTALTQIVLRHANALWQESVVAFANDNKYDDRTLYWARLQMTKALRSAPTFGELLDDQQEKLLWKFELLSRGQQDVKFNKNADYKILLTGFDPFFLDKNLDQSNPSGVAALAFDNLFLSVEGKSIEVETVILPVRFEDFDKGMVETLLKPYFKGSKVDMVVTVSMGRDDFDLEHFPGKRRSAAAPDNLNVLTGANKQNPLIPMLENKPLQGPEFTRYSLPYQAMQQVNSPFKVNDNRKVTTLEKTFEASSLKSLANATSVEGSGGGYLSNEISYRSMILRNDYAPVMPVGHIHTPRFKGFEPEKSEQITEQIKRMLLKAVGSFN